MLNRKVLLGLMMSGFGLSLALPVQAQQVVLTPAGTAFLAPPVQPQQQVSPTVLKAEEAGGVAFTMTTQEAIAPSQLASAQKQAIEKHGRFTKFQGRDIEILASDDPRIPRIESRSSTIAATPGYIAVLDPTAEFMGFKNPESVWMIPESYILNEPKLPAFSMEDLMYRGLPVPPEIRDYKSASFVGVIGVEEPIVNPPTMPIVNPIGGPNSQIMPIVNPISDSGSGIIAGEPIVNELRLRNNSDNIQTEALIHNGDGLYMTAFSQGASMVSSPQQEVSAMRMPSIASPAPSSTVIPLGKTNENLRLIPRIDHASPLSASRILPDLLR
jgi:hypothetical protein